MNLSPHSEQSDLVRPRWPLIALLVAAFFLRAGVLWIERDALLDDPDAYRAHAMSLVESGGAEYQMPAPRPPHVLRAYRPPLYPILLALSGAARSSWAVAALHLVLGMATVIGVYLLGRRMGLGSWALAAAAWTACDPILLNQSTLVMTETLAALLAVAALHALVHLRERPTWPGAALAGAVLGLAALGRPTFLVFLAAAPCAWWFSVCGVREKTVQLGAYVFAAAVVLAPWTARNTLVLGRPIVATTHGGYTLLLGNNPAFYEHLRSAPWRSVWDARELRFDVPAESDVAWELAQDRAAYHTAWRTVHEQPGMFFYSGLLRVGRLWGLVPHQLDVQESAARRALRWSVGAWYLIEFALAAVGVLAILRGKQRGAWLAAGWLALSFTLVHFFYWSDLRMRAPLAPAVGLAAAAGAGWWWSRFRDSKPSRQQRVAPIAAGPNLP